MGQLPKFNTENEDLKLFKKHDTKSKRLQYNLLIGAERDQTILLGHYVIIQNS